MGAAAIRQGFRENFRAACSAEAGRRGRQRRYDAGHAARLNFVRHARELGFEVDEMTRRHIAGIDRRIAHLTVLRAELQRTVDECERGRVCDCRVIETLAGSSHDHPGVRRKSPPRSKAPGR